MISTLRIVFSSFIIVGNLLCCLYFFLCWRILRTQLKKPWFQKRGPLLVQSHVASLMLCIAWTTILELHDPNTGILDPLYDDRSVYQLLCLLWLLTASLSTSVVLARIILQLFKNIHAQVSDHHSLWDKYLIIKYFYILGNERIILAGAFALWIFLAGIIFLIIFANNGGLDEFLGRIPIIMFSLMGFFSIETCVIAYIGKILYDIKDLKIDSTPSISRTNTSDGKEEESDSDGNNHNHDHLDDVERDLEASKSTGKDQDRIKLEIKVSIVEDENSPRGGRMSDFDSFYVWSEIKWILISMNVSMGMIVVGIISEYVITNKFEYVIRIVYYLAALWCIWGIYVQTYYVNDKNIGKIELRKRIVTNVGLCMKCQYHCQCKCEDNHNETNNDEDKNKNKVRADSPSAGDNERESPNFNISTHDESGTGQANTRAKALRVSDVIVVKQGYSVFMAHLKKELSMESLLFVTIMLQWQHFLIKYHFWDIHNKNCVYILEPDYALKLPKNVPKSPLIKQLKNNNNLDKKKRNKNFDIFVSLFEQIYKEYIETNRAPYEINISYPIRRKVQKYVQFINKQKSNTDGFFIESVYENKNENENETKDNDERNGDDKHKSNNDKLNKQDKKKSFWELWNLLSKMCDELDSVLFDSLIRCKRITNSKQFKKYSNT